jgi:hypothetical protein
MTFAVSSNDQNSHIKRGKNGKDHSEGGKKEIFVSLCINNGDICFACIIFFNPCIHHTVFSTVEKTGGLN